MNKIEQWVVAGADLVWGMPLLFLLTGGGLFFMLYSRFLPFKYIRHAVNVLRGKYDDPDDPGDINHFQALSGALAATIGMGNISGVSLAIVAGGPGALFWMWVSAFFGIATKFFTCSLAVLYRGKDTEGHLQGGPMYVIREGLGSKWMPLAIFFSIAGFFGATPVFQSNQLVASVRDLLFGPPQGPQSLKVEFIMGLIVTFFVALVILGGIKRIGNVASKLVPSMLVLYVLSVLLILALNAGEVLPTFAFIISDAFSANAILGGAVGAIIIEGGKRAAFSNEAGIGMAPMMHGAAKTKEPIREGLVAMMGPFFDTLLVCTMTGLCIIITGGFRSGSVNGIELTAAVFDDQLPGVGKYILVICVSIFSITTIFGMAYYGRKCLSFVIGARFGKYFDYWYLMLVLLGAVATLDIVVNLVFIAYGLMAIPTMVSAILLAPKVMAAAKDYFHRMKDIT